MKRIKLTITDDILAQTENPQTLLNFLPKDAKIIEEYINPRSRTRILTIESQSFPDRDPIPNITSNIFVEEFS